MNADTVSMNNMCQQYYVRPFTYMKCVIYMLI